MNKKIMTPEQFEEAKKLNQPVQQPVKTFSVGNDLMIPIKMNELPTRGILYPEGTQIRVRPLKIVEVKQLASLDESNLNDVTNMILNQVVDGVDVETIYAADKLYLIFLLRAITYKEKGINVDFDCPKCSQASQYAFTLDNLNIVQIQDNYLDNKIVEIEDVGTYEFKYQTIKDELFLEKIRNHEITDKTLLAYTRAIDPSILELAMTIEKIDGESVNLTQVIMNLTNLDPIAYSELETSYEEFVIGLQVTMDVKCNKCGGGSTLPIPFHGEFFLPKNRNK